MPTYLYETLDDPPVQFELRQSMREAALARHPQTGAPVRRVISGGYGILQKAAPARPPCGAARPPRGGCCGGHCAHGH